MLEVSEGIYSLLVEPVQFGPAPNLDGLAVIFWVIYIGEGRAGNIFCKIDRIREFFTIICPAMLILPFGNEAENRNQTNGKRPPSRVARQSTSGEINMKKNTPRNAKTMRETVVDSMLKGPVKMLAEFLVTIPLKNLELQDKSKMSNLTQTASRILANRLEGFLTLSEKRDLAKVHADFVVQAMGKAMSDTLPNNMARAALPESLEKALPKTLKQVLPKIDKKAMLDVLKESLQVTLLESLPEHMEKNLADSLSKVRVKPLTKSQESDLNERMLDVLKGSMTDKDENGLKRMTELANDIAYAMFQASDKEGKGSIIDPRRLGNQARNKKATLVAAVTAAGKSVLKIVVQGLEIGGLVSNTPQPEQAWRIIVRFKIVVEFSVVPNL